MSDQKKCSGFPEKDKTCPNPATATVLRVAVCDEHAKQAEASGHRVHRQEKKS